MQLDDLKKEFLSRCLDCKSKDVHQALPTATFDGTPLEKTFPRTGENEGRRYELTLAGETVRAGEPVSATVRVLGPDGKPFTALEPLMGAFAHLVGLDEDRM